jgi:hypothetical protein
MIEEGSAEIGEAVVRWGLAALASQQPRPVYCNVRQFEGGVRVGLEAAGFESFATRALLVKHTVAWLKMPAHELAPALKGGAEPVPPAYRINGEADLQPSKGRLAAERDA